MSTRTESAPKVIALGYYDGATEGFVNGLGDNLVYFFRLIAWDSVQDKRLFLVSVVERVVYEELLEILVKTHGTPTGLTWIPAWKFVDVDLESRANSLVEAGRRNLAAATFLVLGDDIAGTIELVHPKDDRLRHAIALARESGPGDLADLLSRIT